MKINNLKCFKINSRLIKCVFLFCKSKTFVLVIVYTIEYKVWFGVRGYGCWKFTTVDKRLLLYKYPKILELISKAFKNSNSIWIVFIVKGKNQWYRVLRFDNGIAKKYCGRKEHSSATILAHRDNPQ